MNYSLLSLYEMISKNLETMFEVPTKNIFMKVLTYLMLY